MFEVGGVIDLGLTTLTINEPSSPSPARPRRRPGITIIRGGIDMRGHDVIIRHIRVRPASPVRAGRSGWEADAILHRRRVRT